MTEKISGDGPRYAEGDRPDFVVETHSIDFIPPAARHGTARGLFPMWFGANCMAVTISTGALAVVSGLSLWWAGVALVIGVMAGAVFMAYHSAQGPHLGLPQMIQSRAQFGFYGANLPLVIVVLMYLGFFASGGVLGGQAVSALTGVPVWAGIAIESAANIILVLFGYRAIHSFEKVMTVAAVIVFALFTVAMFVSAPVTTHPAAGTGFTVGPFLLTIALGAIYLISYAPYVADYSRYLPETTKVAPTFGYTYAGVVVSGIWMMIIGAILQNRYSSLGIVAQVQAAAGAWGSAFQVIVLLVVALGIVGINSLNIYGGFMAALTVATSYARRWRPTLALRIWFIVPVGLIGTVLAFLERDNFLNSYETFLSFLLYFLIPWTAVNLADFYLVRHGRYSVSDMFTPNGKYGRVQAPGMVAYVVGCLAQIPFVNVSFYEGPVARALGGGDISWIVGIVVSGGCYIAFTRRSASASTAAPETPTADSSMTAEMR
jgi:nucleobase:cation symporter-1, NCS1 family